MLLMLIRDKASAWNCLGMRDGTCSLYRFNERDAEAEGNEPEAGLCLTENLRPTTFRGL